MRKYLLILKAPMIWNGLKIRSEHREYRSYFGQNAMAKLVPWLIWPDYDLQRTFTGRVELSAGQYYARIILTPPDNWAYLNNEHLNLIYFCNPLPAEVVSFSLVNKRGQIYAHYCSLGNDRSFQQQAQYRMWEDKNGFLWKEHTDLSSKLYLQTLQEPNLPSVHKYFEVQMVGENELCTEDYNLWVNPFCLCIPLEGAELDDPVLQNLVEPNLILQLEPLFGPEVASRLYFYLQGERKLKNRACKSGRHRLSTIENLMWGATDSRSSVSEMTDTRLEQTEEKNYHSWKPFASLDLTGGQFYVIRENVGLVPPFVRNEGENPFGADQQEITNYWVPPDNLTPNTRIFANYWLERWNGKELNVNKARNQAEKEKMANLLRQFQEKKPVTPPSYANIPLYPSRTGGVELNREELDLASSSSILLFRQFPQCKTTAFTAIGELLHDVVASPNCTNSTPLDCYRAYLMLECEKARYRLYFDDINYLTEFAQKYIIPFSSIYVAFPPATLPDQEVEEALAKNLLTRYCLDLVGSPYLGAQRFLSLLTTAWQKDLNTEDVWYLPLLPGWWNDWYESLFLRASTTSIRYFIRDSGFILHTSLLGQAPLGSMPNLYLQQEHVRF